MASGKKLLLVQIGRTKLSELQRLCKALGIETIVVEAKDFGKPLGQLARIAGIRDNHGAAPALKPESFMPPVEMMVFCGFAPEALDTFLAACRDAGIAPVGLKAVITPSNIRWNIYTLCRELMQEQQRIK